MTQVQLVLAVIGSLILLASAAGGVWAVFRSSAQDARIKQQEGWINQLTQRVNYLEPRYEQLEKENQLLREMHNPADQIQNLVDQEQRNHEATFGVLQRIETALKGTP